MRLDNKLENVVFGGVTVLLDLKPWIVLKMLKNKCAKVVLRAQWLVTVEGSWEKVGGSSLLQCKTHFGLNPEIFHIFFFMKHFFVDPSPNFVLGFHSVLRRGISGTRLPLSLLTHSLNYLWIPFVLSQWELHCSCLKPLVLSNVVQNGRLSASFQDYNCFLRNPALMDKIMWSSEL